MPDIPRFEVIEDETGYSVITDMDNDELELVEAIIHSLKETRLHEEPQTIH